MKYLNLLLKKTHNFFSDPIKYFVYYKNKLFSCWLASCYNIRCYLIRKKLVNKNFSLFSNDCTAGIILHRLGLRFNSPTINLFFPDLHEYIKFLRYIESYRNSEIQNISKKGDKWPIGLLENKEYGDIVLSFMHYDSFDEAVEKWKKRSLRIISEKIYVILQLSHVDKELVNEFSTLPYHKVIITYPPVFRELKEEIEENDIPYCIINTLDSSPTGQVFQYNGITGKKYIDDSDILRFIQ